MTVEFRLVDELIDEELLTAPTSAWVDNVIFPIVSKTSYRHRWAVNEPVRTGFLNFYFLKPDFALKPNLPAEILRYRDQLVGNCAYLGTQGIIICDTDFLRSFGDSHATAMWGGGDPRTHALGYEGVLNQRTELLCLWIIGHEVGHVLNGDGASAAGEERSPSGMAGQGQTLEKLENAKDREYAADRRFAMLIAKDKKRIDPLISILIDLVNLELEARYGKPDVYYGPGFELDYARKRIAYYFDNDRKQSHPEYIVRAVRILQQIAVSTDDPALQGLLESFSGKFKQADERKQK